MLRRLIRRGALLRTALASAACAAALGCSLFFDPSTLGDGTATATATPDAGDAGDGGDAGPAPAADAGDAAVTAEAANGCPSGKGPSMVRIEDFCIDSTEVTSAQYAVFMGAVGADAGGPSSLPQCSGNDSLTPVVTVGFPAPPPETPEFPVHGIDWCDAKAYCLWAGKDLCSGLAGAKVALTDVTDPQKSQWEKACSKNGTQRFAYADSYTSGRCADGEKPLGPVNATCEGGYAGLFDLVGNIAEWVDACKPPIVAQSGCALMGGYAGSGEIASCTSVDSPPGNIPWPNAGVRCCAPAKN